MKKFKRISVALLLAVIMLVQTVPAFALVSPIVYEVNEDGSITSYVFARDLTNGAKLYTAVYNADGSMALATASAEADKAGYLKTTVAKTEGQTVKSFLWDNKYSPFVTEGEYGDSINIDDITITVNGNDLRSYLAEGEALDFGGSYDINIQEAGFSAVPAVRVYSKDSLVEHSVEYSEDSTSAVVTFMKGARSLSDDAKTITNTAGASFVAERYTKPVIETVTVNFKKTWLGDGDLVSGSPAGTIITNSPLSNLYKKEYTPGEGETVKKINLHIASVPYQGAVVILKPLDASNGKDTLVNSDGSAVAWVDDNGVLANGGSSVKTFDYEAYQPVDYTQISTTAINTNSTITAAAVKELSFGDNKKQNSTRALTDRNPSIAMSVCGVDGSQTSDLEDCNYIVFASAAKTDVTLEFYVNKAVEVNVYAASALTISDVGTDGNTAWDASCKTTGTLNRRYQNSVDAISVAWLIKEGMLRPEDTEYRANGNVRYDIDGDGNKESTETLAKIMEAGTGGDIVTGSNMSAYYIYRYDVIDALVEASGSSAGWGFDTGYGDKDIPSSILPYYYSETYRYSDYLNMWDDREYSAERAPLISEFNHASKFTVTDMPMSVISGEHKGETAVYTGDVAISDGVKFKIIDFFSDTITPDRTGLIADENGVLKNQNATGALVSYPDGFGLEDATFICFTNGPINDAGYCYASSGYYDVTPPKAGYHDVWVNTAECYEWYNFKVSRDAEVLVFATGNVKFLDNDENYSKTILDTADSVQVMRNMNNSDKYSATRLYTAAVGAGKTVTMKTPGYANVLYCVFVKEAQSSEVDATLSTLTVNGTELEGFDPDVTEYTYALSEAEALSLTAPVVEAAANDENATVTVYKPESFPGSSRIVVNHRDGGTKIYTVNYIESHEYVTDLSSGVEGKTPLYIKNGLVVGDSGYLASDRMSEGSWRISAINQTYLENNDIILGGVNWTDVSSITFTLKRPATVRLLINSHKPALEVPITEYGFVLNADITTLHIEGANASGGTRTYPRMFEKEFAAGTYTIPFAIPDMPILYAFEYLPFE